MKEEQENDKNQGGLLNALLTIITIGVLGYSLFVLLS